MPRVVRGILVDDWLIRMPLVARIIVHHSLAVYLASAATLGIVTYLVARSVWKKRSMFRFSLRDLLLVTVIVALAVGWWLNNWSSRVVNAQRRNETLKAHTRIMQLQDQVRMLQRRNERPDKLPFNPNLWTVEEIAEAVAKGERDAAAREAR